jgi:hypothetical protein
MRIGISVDGVLRNIFTKIEEVHEKYFPSEEGVEPIKIMDYDLEKWVTFPDEEVQEAELEFDPNFDESSFFESEDEIKLTKTVKKTTLNEFLYEKCTLEIYGYSNEVISSGVETLNQLIIDNPNHEFIIISREIGLSIPSTLFFLSKTKSMCPNIKFVKNYEDVWDYVDIMITDHPKILNSRPSSGKISVVIDKPYNEKINQSGIRIKTIKEIDTRVLESLESSLFIK